MAWCYPVWFEYSKTGQLVEFEETIPSNWVDEAAKIVYWPPKNDEFHKKRCSDPGDNWQQFKLKYVKIHGCELETVKDYGDNMTANEDTGVMEAKRKENVPKEKSAIANKVVNLPKPPSSDLFSSSRNEKKEKLKKKKKKDKQTAVLPNVSKIKLSTIPGGSPLAFNNEDQSITTKDKMLQHTKKRTYPSYLGVEEEEDEEDGNNILPKKSKIDMQISARTDPPSPVFASSPETVAANKRTSKELNNLTVHTPRGSPSESTATFSRGDSAAEREKILPSLTNFDRYLEKEISDIKTRVDDIYRLLINIQADLNKEPRDLEKGKELPTTFDDLHAFKSFDEKISKKEAKFYAKQLKGMGGRDGRKLVSNILQRLMSNKLQSVFNLTGSDNKEPFQELTFYKIIQEAVKMTFKDKTDASIRTDIGNHLKQSPYRRGGSKAKNGEKNIANIANVVNNEDSSLSSSSSSDEE